jgi:hypothetical protein
LAKTHISSPQQLSQSKPTQLIPIFGDDKTAKQVLSAAKRATKKRAAAKDDDGQELSSPARKKSKVSPHEVQTPASLEESLALPEFITDEAEIEKTVLITNRAPLVLAFAVVLLKYTMPEQPLSSRLSLAQAVVSMNSRSKAVSLGLESGKSAEEEGWGRGQSGVRVLGREIRTMKRCGWREPASNSPNNDTTANKVDTETEDEPPALWALDLEALRKASDDTVNDGTGVGYSTDLPIYQPQPARLYLLKSFERKADDNHNNDTKAKQAKDSQLTHKRRNLALLLGALDLGFKSWHGKVSAHELDSKAWSWYIHVRPDTEWGARSEVPLRTILRLVRRDPLA